MRLNVNAFNKRFFLNLVTGLKPHAFNYWSCREKRFRGVPKIFLPIGPSPSNKLPKRQSSHWILGIQRNITERYPQGLGLLPHIHQVDIQPPTPHIPKGTVKEPTSRYVGKRLGGNLGGYTRM